MQKKGTGYRIGTSQVHTNGQVKPVVGYRQRSQQERADALWIVSTHSSENEARAEESILSLQYQIPTMPFVSRDGEGDQRARSRQGPTSIGSSHPWWTSTAEQRLLTDRKLSIDHPHYRPRSRNSSRRRVVITLCADRRGATPMHRIASRRQRRSRPCCSGEPGVEHPPVQEQRKLALRERRGRISAR